MTRISERERGQRGAQGAALRVKREEGRTASGEKLGKRAGKKFSASL